MIITPDTPLDAGRLETIFHILDQRLQGRDRLLARLILAHLFIALDQEQNRNSDFYAEALVRLLLRLGELERRDARSQEARSIEHCALNGACLFDSEETSAAFDRIRGDLRRFPNDSTERRALIPRWALSELNDLQVSSDIHYKPLRDLLQDLLGTVARIPLEREIRGFEERIIDIQISTSRGMEIYYPQDHPVLNRVITVVAMLDQDWEMWHPSSVGGPKALFRRIQRLSASSGTGTDIAQWIQRLRGYPSGSFNYDSWSEKYILNPTPIFHSFSLSLEGRGPGRG